MKLLKLRKTISRWYFCCFIINSTAQKSISTFTSTKTKMLLNSMIHVKARRARNLFVRSAQLSTIVRQLHCARTRWRVGRVFSSTFRFNQFSYRWSLFVEFLGDENELSNQIVLTTFLRRSWSNPSASFSRLTRFRTCAQRAPKAETCHDKRKIVNCFTRLVVVASHKEKWSW